MNESPAKKYMYLVINEHKMVPRNHTAHGRIIECEAVPFDGAKPSRTQTQSPRGSLLTGILVGTFALALLAGGLLVALVAGVVRRAPRATLAAALGLIGYNAWKRTKPPRP